MISINAAFDGGNIEVQKAEAADDIQLAIRKDSEADFFQWFSFRLAGARGQDCVLRIMNAGQASYTRGWEGYQAVASSDGVTWRRVPTTYENGVLTIRHAPETDAVHYAYFAPYPMERHADLVARCQASDGVSLTVPGVTALGRPIEVLRFGEPGEAETKGNGAKRRKPSLWVIARQHPGETMAEWFMEGFLDRLLDPEDGAATALLRSAVIHAVPNMNPDGSALGNLRVNALGTNLNREWESPSLEKSPEVFHVRQMMQDSGIDLCLDVHGDEGLPYNFIAGFEGIAEASAEQLAAMNKFRDTLAWLNPDFQTEHGYPKATPGKGMKTTSTGYLAAYHAVVSMTLEMPFKDTANAPNPTVGWSPDRARSLGRSTIEAMLAVAGDLPLKR
jgi:murein tripeptide amidase MpaA